MKTAIITINKDGEGLAEKLRMAFPEADIFNGRMKPKGPLKNLVRNIFNKYDGLIFIVAMGITVRLIGELAKNKFCDPAVVSVDTAGRFSISVLSGHEGGANKLAYLVAAALDAIAVITTGREVRKRFIVGIGARRAVKARQVKEAILRAVKNKRIGLDEVRLAATVDLKKYEPGILEACDGLSLPLVFIPREKIANFKGGLPSSKAARRHLGVDGVCEPCALLAGRRTRLIARKKILDAVTVAIAEERLV